jgi:CheY-like chemotaxis protein
MLIVDDNSSVRRLIRELVAGLADDIEECENGLDAIAACERCRPDLVLMDVCMEPIDGLEATGRIRSRDDAARVIVITDYDDPALREAARRAGACDYQLKEDLLQLPETILRLMQDPPCQRVQL